MSGGTDDYLAKLAGPDYLESQISVANPGQHDKVREEAILLMKMGWEPYELRAYNYLDGHSEMIPYSWVTLMPEEF